VLFPRSRPNANWLTARTPEAVCAVRCGAVPRLAFASAPPREPRSPRAPSEIPHYTVRFRHRSSVADTTGPPGTQHGTGMQIEVSIPVYAR
jgi:hypothetical protein